ncbi:MAG: (2Fe-2S)-binding protein [Actinobacteria bacterium]|nr:(2Fe-2S)-binding protein [Actinomycetota bacterium]
MGGIDERARRAVLADVGPFFALAGFRPNADWRPARELIDAGGLSARVDRVAALLAAAADVSETHIDRRAAASTSALGVIARLVAVGIGSAALTGAVPRLSLDDLWWQPVDGPLPLASTNGCWIEVRDVETATAALYADVMDPVVIPVITAYQRRFRLSSQVLLGNLASAVAGAAMMLVRAAAATAIDPFELARSVTSRPVLAGAGRWKGNHFTRSNCCLFYRVPAGGYCGDCVITARPRTSHSERH